MSREDTVTYVAAPGVTPPCVDAAEEDRKLVDAVSRAAVERYFRIFLTHSLRAPLGQVQKRLVKIERMVERSFR